MNKITYISIAVFLIAVIALSFFLAAPKKSLYTDLDGFAKCLAEKKITMYGAEWCTHCKAEKERFGESWKFVPYVECPGAIDACLALGIESYPTWILPSGEKLVGEQGLQTLADKSACELK